MAILRRTKKAMMRAMCGVKIIEKRRGQELMSLLGSKDTLDGLARASGVQWYGHVLRRDNGNVLRRALVFEVAGRRGHGGLNVTWKRQVEEHINQIGLKREDAIDRVKWQDGVYKLLKKHEVNLATCINVDTTRFRNWISHYKVESLMSNIY